ncbi:MAG: Maf family protein, partial [Clostridia bacterium]|nr:Maf family protein [Clostridia bacterium]
MSAKVILASSSPRRREILAEMGIDFEVCPTDAD